MMLRRLTLLFLLSALPAWAEEPNLSTAPQAATGSASHLALAQAAYVRALRDGEVMLLLSAIRLARGVTLRPATGWQKLTGGDEAAAPPDRANFPDPASDVAMDIARNLAGEDPDLQDLVYDLDAQRPGTTTRTAVEALSTVAAGEVESWTLPLFGEVSAEVAVIGTGDTALSLTLADEGGTVICTHAASPDPSLCRLTPARNGFFTVTIRNHGTTPADYRLLGN